MGDIRFAFPIEEAPLWIGVGVAVVAALVFVLRWYERRRQARLHRVVESDLAPRLLPGYDASVRRPLFWLTVLGAAGLVLTFAQPRWGKAWVEVARGSRDILVLLDTSESMNAENPLPSRLARAKQEIESLIEKCPGDRFGLVVFSGEAELQCPLTMDHAYFQSVLAAINTNSLSTEGTDIAKAIRVAAETLEEDIAETGEENRHARALLLISDGEQVSGDAVAAAEQLGRYAGIYVMGIGDPEGVEVPYPPLLARYGKATSNTQPHLSKLDEDTLVQIAEAGGNHGVYVRSRADNKDIEHIHAALENVLARATRGELRFNLVNRYRWPLAFALLCFAGEGLWYALMPWVRHWRLRRGSSEANETIEGETSRA